MSTVGMWEMKNYQTMLEKAGERIRQHQEASTRFEVVEGSGYLYLMDSYNSEPVRDGENHLITFDIEKNNKDAAYKAAEEYINENYSDLIKWADEAREEQEVERD